MTDPVQKTIPKADAELVWQIAQEKWNAQADNGNQWDALGQDEMSLLIVREAELQLAAIALPVQPVIDADDIEIEAEMEKALAKAFTNWEIKLCTDAIKQGNVTIRKPLK